MSKEKKYILQKEIIENKLNRLALEIVENNIDERELIFVGIDPGGPILAKRLRKLVQSFTDMEIELITMRMNKRLPEEIHLSATPVFNNKVIIVIDDVTNRGKTLLYAMKPFLEFQPKKIQTLVLVERSHTRFPIHANYKGFSLATTLHEHIYVETEGQIIKGAYLA